MIRNRFEHRLRQRMRLEQVPEVQDRRFIGDRVAAEFKMAERAPRLDVVERFLGTRIGQVIPLLNAYELARANAGAAGVNGMTFARIETLGLEAWLAGLRKDLVSKTYRPDPVRRVSIPKADGVGERLLGIPTIRDRVVQTAKQ